MQLRDISLRGYYKFLLVVNIILPALLLPLILVVYLLRPEAFHVDTDGFKFLLMTIRLNAHPIVIGSVGLFLALINAIIQSSIQAFVLTLLARYTAIGKITLSATTHNTQNNVQGVFS